jgi:hypothetical protein
MKKMDGIEQKASVKHLKQLSVAWLIPATRACIKGGVESPAHQSHSCARFAIDPNHREVCA